jgi:hypothetical protein
MSASAIRFLCPEYQSAFDEYTAELEDGKLAGRATVASAVVIYEIASSSFCVCSAICS